MVDDTDNILIIGNPSSICVEAKSISTQGRSTAGVQMINGSKIVRVVKL